MSSWLRSIEEMKLASLDRGTRVLGIVSPTPSAGCTEVARLLANASQRSGSRTLLVDLARAADPAAEIPTGSFASPWSAWMTVFEETGLPNDVSARQLRKSLQASLEGFRVTRQLVMGVAVTASDLLAHVIEEAKPKRIGLRVALSGKQLMLEILHDGAPLTGLGQQLVSSSPCEVISPLDANLPIALARRTLPRWDYQEGQLHRLVGWCHLDGGGPLEVPPIKAEDCERLSAAPAKGQLGYFNNVEQMRRLFHQELAKFEAIIVDLPPVQDDCNARINPLASVAACDGVYLLCMAGDVDRGSLYRTMTLLGQSDAKVLGVVVNDACNPSLGEELAREARRLSALAPGFSRWLERKALGARFIN